MGRTFESIDDKMKEFLESAPVFFVATAPSGDSGHINVSPKGLDSFKVISPNQVAYLDITGSGAETIAHIRDNKRITLMFADFSGKPLIIRLYGKGRTILTTAPEFAQLYELFDDLPGVRSIIQIDVTRISNSCGFGVPIMEFKENRKELTKWSEVKGEEKIVEYQAEKNLESIDGLPALKGEI